MTRRCWLLGILLLLSGCSGKNPGTPLTQLLAQMAEGSFGQTKITPPGHSWRDKTECPKENP